MVFIFIVKETGTEKYNTLLGVTQLLIEPGFKARSSGLRKAFALH